MNAYRITIDGHDYEVRLLSDPRQEVVQVEVNGKRLTVSTTPLASGPERDGAQPADAQPAPAPVASGGTGALLAPLPGVIKSIAVTAGQEVAPGQTLLVIEAMKMDNLLRASRKATVKQLLVSVGQQVAYGQPLLDYAA